MARPLTITAYGNAQVDTADKKSGTGSLLLDGASDYLIVTNTNGEVNVDSGNWTVECWINADDSANADYPIIESNLADTNGFPSLNYYWSLVLQVEDDPNNRIRFSTTGGVNTTTLTISNVAKSSVVTGWHHIAVVYDGTNITLFYDGVEKGSITGSYYGLSTKEDSGSPLPRNLNIGGGGVYGAGTSYWYDGWIDELRISNVARYSTTFTPETRFQPDADTLLLIHMDGADASTTFTDDVGVQGEADLSSSSALTATANPNPSIVDMNIVYTWDDLDVSWDYWHRNVDAWLIRDPLELETQINIEVLEITNAVLGSSELAVSAAMEVDGGIVFDATADLDSNFELQAEGGIVKDAEATLADNFGFAIEALAVRQDTPNLEFQFALEVEADITRNASANLEALGFLVSDSRLSDVRGSATLETQFALSVEADNFKNASAVLESQTELTAEGQRLITGIPAEQQCVFSLEADALNLKIAQAEVESTVTLVCSAGILFDAAADLDSTTDLSAQAQVTVDGSSSILASTELSVQGRILKLADIYIEDFAELSAEATVEINASADLVSQFQTTARGGLLVEPNEVFDYDWEYPDNWDGFPIDQWGVRGFVVFDNFGIFTNGGLSLSGNADLESQAELQASAAITRNVSANLDSQFTVDVSGGRILDAQANLEALGFLVSEGDSIPAKLGSASISSEFTLTSGSAVLVDGRANLESLGFVVSDSRISNVRASSSIDAEFAISVDSNIIRNASASLASEFTVDAIPFLALGGEARLESLGFLLSDGRISDVRASASLQFQFEATFSAELRLIDSGSLFYVLPESRTASIDSEQRVLDILSETRSIEVESEQRSLLINAETRTLEIER